MGVMSQTEIADTIIAHRIHIGRIRFKMNMLRRAAQHMSTPELERICKEELDDLEREVTTIEGELEVIERDNA